MGVMVVMENKGQLVQQVIVVELDALVIKDQPVQLERDYQAQLVRLDRKVFKEYKVFKVSQVFKDQLVSREFKGNKGYLVMLEKRDQQELKEMWVQLVHVALAQLENRD